VSKHDDSKTSFSSPQSLRRSGHVKKTVGV
jgi:hypothetical protein